MTAPNLDRIREFDRLLNSLDPDKFDMSYWHCGTSACALGHACMHPPFMEQGLHLNFKVHYPYPVFEEFFGHKAGAEFFGLYEEDARYLFNPEKYFDNGEVFSVEELTELAKAIHPKEVSHRLRHLMKEKYKIIL